MERGKIVSLEDRIPKLKQQRRRKANKRLVFLLLFFFLLISCIIYFQSPLSHVKNISVTGNELYSPELIKKTSSLTRKTNIWKVNEEEVSTKLMKLPELKKATVEVKFPNTVNIHIIEYKRIAYINKDNGYSGVLENGKILPKMSGGAMPVNAPILIGFKKGKVLSEMVNSLDKLPDGIANSISEIHYSPTETDDYSITLYMNDGFEVLASLRSFSKKMAHYPSIISQLKEDEKGIIDLQVGSYFKAYDQEGAEKGENEDEG